MAEQRTTIEQPDGYPTVHVWTSHGELWVCAAYDHGPMCRLCRRADQVLADLIQNVSEGKILVRADSEGELRFKLTAQGERDAENLIATDVEMAALYASRRQPRPKLNEVEEKVLVALVDAGGEATPEALVDATGYTQGQVEAALATLAAVGFTGDEAAPDA